MGGLIALTAALAVSCLLLAALRLRDKVRIARLTEQAEDFLTQGGPALDVALREDTLAALHNALADTQGALLLAREHQSEECSRTSQLTADISHQLKTPLAALRLYAEMDAAPHMSQSLAQIERMEALIASLLRLERLCADGYTFAFAPYDVEEIIQMQWQSLTTLWPDRVLTVEGRARIRCDAGWLGEAFLNLLKNACEHTLAGGHIHITLERTEAAFHCTVEDNGGGVKSADLPRLFERFYRAEHQDARGAGIGLAIVKEIIRRHHGMISADNTAQGLRITISIPLMDNALTRY